MLLITLWVPRCDIGHPAPFLVPVSYVTENYSWKKTRAGWLLTGHLLVLLPKGK